jgi:hypothetical protein
MLHRLICAATFAGMTFIGTAQEARADCPDLPVRCGADKVGWRGQCFSLTKGCKPCGPAHCKARPGESQVKRKLVSPHPKGKECRRLVRNYVVERDSKSPSSCSVPGGAKDVFELASLVFGKSACMEHDICYYLPGVSRKACDDAFLVNMKANCQQANLRKLGTADCLVAANLFHRSVRIGAKNMRKRSNLGVCKEIPDDT